MKLYVNNHRQIIKLSDENGRQIIIRPSQRILLPEYFDKYVQTGHLAHAKATSPTNKDANFNQRIRSRHRISESVQRQQNKDKQIIIEPNTDNPLPKQASTKRHTNKQVSRINTNHTRNIIKRKRQVDADNNSKIIRTNKKNKFHGHLKNSPTDIAIYNQTDNVLGLLNISNNIGIGILSYNRLHCLKRLIDSILNYTDLSRTTIFISDDGSTDPALLQYLDDLDKLNRFCILKNGDNSGISVNSNRLLQCLERFEYGILLNDDVEIMNHGWEFFYPDAMHKTGFKHLLYRQQGVYGATIGDPLEYNGIRLLKTDDKPHGAILAFDTDSLKDVGYFDESYGQYGMEHVDWSMKFYERGLNGVPGFFDVEGADKYFKIHSEATSVENKSEKLKLAKDLFDRRDSKPCKFSDRSKISSISIIIPYRDLGRSDSVITVIDNMRGQLFPKINIILVEHDLNSQVETEEIFPAIHYLVQADSNEPFNKSKAFNLGVDSATDEFIILHDADMIMPNYYVKEIFKTLLFHDSCHLGKDVSYYNESDTTKINDLKKALRPETFERYVSYFEGGSLAIRKANYSKIGGFYEDYSGYGCEDCDFYLRMSIGGNFKNDRRIPLYHLWHPRHNLWNEHHDANLRLQANLDRLTHEARLADAKDKLNQRGYDTI